MQDDHRKGQGSETSRRVKGGELSAEIISQLKFDVEGQTSLPSIESAKLSPSGRHCDLNSGSPLRPNEEHSRSRRRGGSCKVITVGVAKMPSLVHTDLPTGKFSRRSDDIAIKQERSLERVTAKRANSACKLSLEPSHCPDVDLKLPMPKLCNLSPVQNDSVKNIAEGPFSCTCKHCGLKFGKHSIAIHKRRCHESIKHQSQQRECLSDTTGRNSCITEAPVARIVTIGLGSAQCEHLTVHARLPPRPGTQTLHNSSLRDSGYGLPYIPSASEQHCATNPLRNSPNVKKNDSSSHGMMILCEKCGRVVAADRISVHSRLCKSDAQCKVSTSSVRFPSTCNLLKVEQESLKQPGPRTCGKKPPTIVCYICGREYGTKSIAIHKPQCLKKFEMENRKLPISKRKPLPKKRPQEKPKLVRIFSKEEQIIASNSCPTDNELIHERMDMIFQQCYSDFERELVPCKRCGRKFSPDRHKQHEPKCNAKPLSIHKSKSISSRKSIS